MLASCEEDEKGSDRALGSKSTGRMRSLVGSGDQAWGSDRRSRGARRVPAAVHVLRLRLRLRLVLKFFSAEEQNLPGTRRSHGSPAPRQPGRQRTDVPSKTIAPNWTTNTSCASGSILASSNEGIDTAAKVATASFCTNTFRRFFGRSTSFQISYWPSVLPRHHDPFSPFGSILPDCLSP